MYWELTDEDLEKIKEISEVTGVDYELKGNLVPVDSLIYALKDMLYEYHNKQEELKDLHQDIEDNYQPRKIDPYEEYGVSRNDFFQEDNMEDKYKVLVNYLKAIIEDQTYITTVDIKKILKALEEVE